MDSGVNSPRKVSQHKDMECNERIGAMNGREIATAFNHSGAKISGKALPEI
jgi:hypothetical protein